VSLLLSVVNGARCIKLARCVLSLIHVLSEASILILEAGRIFEIILWVPSTHPHLTRVIVWPDGRREVEGRTPKQIEHKSSHTLPSEDIVDIEPSDIKDLDD
jgi:hypothetical protein